MTRFTDALCYLLAALVWGTIFAIFAILCLPLLIVGAIVSPRKVI